MGIIKKVKPINEILPNFIVMTNYCESRGYEFDFVRASKGIRTDLYVKKELYKKGEKYHKTCLDAQKYSYTALYKMIANKTKTQDK